MTVNDQELRQLYGHFSKELRDYLRQIGNRYYYIWQERKCDKQINLYNELEKIASLGISDYNNGLIKIEQDTNTYRNNALISNPELTKEELEVPLVSDGKYYNDHKIHIHPFNYPDSNDLFNDCEEIIYAVLMKQFLSIEPIDEKSNQSLKNISSYITNGVAAYCMQEIKQNNIISKDYPKNYSASLEYINTIFNELINDPSRKNMIYDLFFRGSVEQIISYTTTQTTKPVEIYKEYKSLYPTGIIERGIVRELTKEPIQKAGYLSSLLYVLIIIAVGLIIAFLLR